MRHFESSAQETAADPAASQLADAVYDQMRFLADDPYDCLALSRLDDLRGQFEASVAFLEPILRQQLDPGQMIIFRDDRFKHGATPLVPPPGQKAVRDALVCTVDYRSTYLEPAS